MHLTEIIHPSCVKVPLCANSKQEAINELVDLLIQEYHLKDGDELKQAVLARETTRTTGIGHGIAIPHGKTGCCDELIMAVGVPTEPLEFNAIDGKPVDLIFLLVSPASQTGLHIQALAAVSKMLVNDEHRHALKSASDSQSLYKMIEGHQD